MAVGLVLNVYVQKGRICQPLLIHNQTPWLMCIFEILHGMHPVVFQFLNKRLLDYMTTFQLMNNYKLFAQQLLRKLHNFFF
jgi:hypothetical protein